MKKSSYYIHRNHGLTLVEVLVATSILVLISFAVSNFQTNIISFNTGIYDSLTAQADGRRIVRTIVTEIRNVTPSVIGSYPIEVASSTILTFYADVDDNGQAERIRYFLNNKLLQKGVITPSGSPLGYTGSESISTIVSDISNGSVPIFEYYDSSYSGTSSPLTQPVDISRIRLIKITVHIDKDPTRAPAAVIYTSQVSMRNLKDNL